MHPSNESAGAGSNQVSGSGLDLSVVGREAGTGIRKCRRGEDTHRLLLMRSTARKRAETFVQDVAEKGEVLGRERSEREEVASRDDGEAV